MPNLPTRPHPLVLHAKQHWYRATSGALAVAEIAEVEALVERIRNRLRVSTQ